MGNIKNRGFASFSEEKRKIVATSGARRAHALGVAYQFSHEIAVLAGKKGKKGKSTK